METTVRIHRSAEYIKARALEMGDNAPEVIDVPVDPADLSREARAVLMEGQDWTRKHVLPAKVYNIKVFAEGSSETLDIRWDLEPEAATPTTVSALILKTAARCREKLAEKLAYADEKRAAEEAEASAALDAYLAGQEGVTVTSEGDTIVVYTRSPQPGISSVSGRVQKSHPRYTEAKALWQAILDQRRVDAEKAEVEKKAAIARRAVQLREWITVHGDANQRGRLELGLMPEEEILDTMRRVIYGNLDEFPRYRKIRQGEVMALCEHADHRDSIDMECEVEPATELTAAEYDQLDRVRKAAPDGSVFEVLTHSCRWDCGDSDHPWHEVARSSVKVVLALGDITLSREYALNDQE